MILKLWPALLPLVVYWLWIVYVRKRAAKLGQPIPRFRDGPWFWAVLASLAIGIGCFIVTGLGEEPIKGTYVPSHMEDGVLVPGKVVP